jgi:hypothetical protein
MKSFKEFLVEQTQIDEKYEVEVSVRDARKAQDIAQDMFRGTYKNKGSNVYVFKKEDDYEDFVDTLKQHKIEILKEQIDEATKFVGDRNLKVTSGKDSLYIGIMDGKLEFMINMKEVISVTSPADVKAIKDHIAKV